MGFALHQLHELLSAFMVSLGVVSLVTGMSAIGLLPVIFCVPSGLNGSTTPFADFHGSCSIR